MSYLESQEESDVIPALGLALMALVTMFMVSSMNLTWTEVKTALQPAREQLVAFQQQGGEVVYALAVSSGVIPEEESAYAYVPVPVNHHEDIIRASRVAGVYTNTSISPQPELPVLALDVPSTPWQVLYDALSGQ